MQKTYRNVANLTTDLSREFSRRLRKPRENASKERTKIIKKHAMKVIELKLVLISNKPLVKLSYLSQIHIFFC